MHTYRRPIALDVRFPVARPLCRRDLKEFMGLEYTCCMSGMDKDEFLTSYCEVSRFLVLDIFKYSMKGRLVAYSLLGELVGVRRVLVSRTKLCSVRRVFLKIRIVRSIAFSRCITGCKLEFEFDSSSIKKSRISHGSFTTACCIRSFRLQKCIRIFHWTCVQHMR